jgi:hypothetical protein
MLVITAVLVATAAAVLLSIASIGGFDPSKRAISDPVEGTETQAVENPARPEHPGFPPPTTTNNLSIPSGVNGSSSSLAAQTLVKASTAAITSSGYF